MIGGNTDKELSGILDIEHFNAVTDGDLETMQEIINIFLCHSPRIVEELITCSEARDLDKLRRAAHKLKPMLSYVGMVSIYERTSRVEDEEITNENWEDISLIIKSIQLDYKIACEKLRAFQQTLTN